MQCRLYGAAEREKMSENIPTQIVEENGIRKLRVDLEGKTFYLPFKEIGGRMVAFLDISGQVSLIEAAAEALVRRMEESGVEFDTILNPVSKSNALSHAIAVRWSERHPNLTHTVVARKSSDPSHTVRASYHSVTTAGNQMLSLTPEDTAFIRGKKILLVDDVYGGGGTTNALTELAKQAGAEITAHAVVAVEQGATYPENLYFLFELPVL